MHRSRVLLVVVATMLSGAAGVAWGLGRPQSAASHSKSESEFGQVHVLDPKTAAGGAAVESIKAKWVQIENARPGTSDWRVSNAGRPGDIEGFADKVSAVAGDTVKLFVSTKDSSYRVEAYRIGYYGGLGARLVWKSASLPGHVQDKAVRDRPTNMVAAPWTPSFSVPITTGFPPGVYLFKLVGDSGVQHYVPLTVRDDRSTAAFVVQNSVTTWQAYNLWGGYDLYEGKNGSGGSDFDHRARVVSFDRPYSMGAGSADFLGNEFPLVSLVESLGLDVTYWTDIDLHERASQLTRHRSLLTLGHDEYWSREMRTGAEQARDQGMNIAFFGANAVFRHIRLEPSPLGPDRHQVDYKRPHEDPLYGVDNKNVTSDWRMPPVSEPESTLIGNLYECNPVKADLVVADPSAWVFAGTGLSRGDRLKQLVGPEYDRYDPTAPGPRNVQVLAHSPLRCAGKSSYSDMTYYTAPSGAGVWASGTNWWISKLSEECTQSTLSPTTTSSSSTTTTFPAQPSVTRASVAPAICPKQAVIKMTENVLNAFGVGPAGRTNPSTATNMRDLPTGRPDANAGDVPTTQYRQRSRTTVTNYYYPRNTVATEPAYSPQQTTPTREQYTTPTRRLIPVGPA